MAKIFYYPSSNLNSATITDGTADDVVATTFTSSNSVTNEERVNDQSIGTAIGSFSTGATPDCIRIDLSSSEALTAVAIYALTTGTSDVTVYPGSSSTAITTGSGVTLSNLSAGWNIGVLASTSRYWFIVADSGTGIDIAEIMLGDSFTFPFNFELNNTLGEISGADNITAWGGQEYSNKRHENKTTWNWNWKYLSSANKTSLDTINTNVGDHTKFIYYDETNYNWVKQTKLMKFTEVAPSVYSTNVSLREQLI